MAEDKEPFKVEVKIPGVTELGEVTTKAVEFGFYAAKEFLDKLIMPSVGEVGQFLMEPIAEYWRKRTFETLLKAHKYCEDNCIKVKPIPLKLIHPLLESASIENDDELQDKWAILLGNLVDTDQNIQSHVLPYILSQISLGEFNVIKEISNRYFQRRRTIEKESNEFLPYKARREEEIYARIAARLKEINEDDLFASKDIELNRLMREQNKLTSKDWNLKKQYLKTAVLDQHSLTEVEIANVIRLGLLKQNFTSHGKVIKEYNSIEKEDVSVDVTTKFQYFLTDLGHLFIKACSEKAEDD